MRLHVRVLLCAAVLAVILAGAFGAAAQTFSIAPGSPTAPAAGPPNCLAGPFSPFGDMLQGPPFFPVVTSVVRMGPPGCGLGWPGPPIGANLDGFSSGLFPIPVPVPAGAVSFQIGVDAGATGMIGPCIPAIAGPFPPDVGSEACGQAIASDAGADVFNTVAPPAPLPGPLMPGAMPNFQIVDGNGVLAPGCVGPTSPGTGLAEPTPGGDVMDDFDAAALGAWFFPPAGLPMVPVYYSVDPPTAAAAGFLPSDVFVKPPGLAAIAVYAPPPALGLDLIGGPGSDNIDALAVDDVDGAPLVFTAAAGDIVLFSLTPASATVGTPNPPGCPLAGLPRAAADIFSEGTLFGAPGAACTLVPAENMNLWTGRFCGPNPITGFVDDNLDGLDVVPPVAPPVTATPTPTATITPGPGATSTLTATPVLTATPTVTATPTPILTCTPPPAPAPTATPVTAGALKCKRAIAKNASKFYTTKTKILQKCENDVVKTGSGTCPNATVTTQLAKAVAGLAAGIDKACGGTDKICNGDLTEETPAGLGWPAACPNFESNVDPDCSAAIADCGDIAGCIGCVGEAAVDQAIDLYYASLVPSTPGSALNKCQQAIGKHTSKFLQTKEKAIAKCWDARINGKHAGVCPDPLATLGSPSQKAAARIAKAEAKKVKSICQACGGADKLCDASVTTPSGAVIAGSGNSDDFTPAAIGFPPSCNAVKVPGGGPQCSSPIVTLADIVECVDCVTEFKVDCIDRARVPEFGVYPCECNP